MEIKDNKIYASTDLGIKVGEIKPAINLKDFINWLAPLAAIPNDTFIRSGLLSNKLYWMSKFTLVEYDGTSSNTYYIETFFH